MSFQLFDKIRALFKSTSLYGHENIFQNQPDISRVAVNNEIINYNSQGIINQTNLSINRFERYKDYDQMDEVGCISLALDLYADESTQIDSEHKKVLLIKANSTSVKEELERLFYDILSIDSYLRPMIRHLAKYGDFAAEIVPSVNRDSVASLRHINIYRFVRVETRFGDLVGFYFIDNNNQATFLHPWQVMHLRLMSFENIYVPYGRSIIDSARKEFRRLRLMEDAALIYRITRAPEKRVFTIPVGNIPSSEVPAYLTEIANQFKKTRFYDPATGEVNWRYAPLIQEDDFWMPKRPDGSGPEVTTLPGAENLGQIADIEYFKKNMVAALKIPFSRVGIGSEAAIGSDKSLASTSSEFAKAVHWLQKEAAAGLRKVALVHLALKGFSIDDMNGFTLSLTASSAIDELYRIETWNSRATVIASLKDTNLFPDEWIIKHFTDMTDDEIKQMAEKKPAEAEEGASLTALPSTLPGLGEESLYDHKMANEVLNEYNNIRKSLEKPETINENLFDRMANLGELGGLPAKSSSDLNVIEEQFAAPHEQYLVAPFWAASEEARIEAETAKNENLNIIKSGFGGSGNPLANTEDPDSIIAEAERIIQESK